MLPYFLLFAAFAIPAIGEASRPTRGKLRLFLPGVLLVILIGLRREVGGDWWNYLQTFHYIELANFSDAMRTTEPAYALLNWVAVQAGWGIWFPNLICAIIFIWGLLVFCRTQPNPILAVAVAIPFFVIGVGMGYTRQSAAVGFVLIALTQYMRGETLKVIFSIALAMSFHVSALVIVPLLGLTTAQDRAVIFVLLIALGIFLFFEFSSYLSRYQIYAQETFTATGAVPRLIMNVMPAALFLGFRRRFVRSEIELKLWTVFALASVGMIGVFFLFPSSGVVDRLGIYLFPLQLVVLSRVPIVFGKSSQQNMLFVLLILAYTLSYQIVWLNFGNFSRPWVPYKNYLWDFGPPGRRPVRAPVRQ